MLINLIYHSLKTSIIKRLKNEIGYEMIGIKICDPENGARFNLICLKGLMS